MSFTRGQQKYFRPMVKAAWAKHCVREKIHPDSRMAYDNWYRSVLLDSAGIYTTKEANPAADFDAVMLAFAQIAGDDYWIKRCSEGVERRWKFLIDQKLRALGKTRAYLGGILRHMRLDQQPLDDLPAEYLQKVFIALDEQFKRHRHGRELTTVN